MVRPIQVGTVRVRRPAALPGREQAGLKRPIAIAIDGPVASGKTAVGMLVAERLGCRFLDTGLMYRAITHVALKRGVGLEDAERLAELTERAEIRLTRSSGRDRLSVDGDDVTERLTDSEVERGVSLVAAISGVRRALVGQQRDIARGAPIVMAGRDIGTVVLPDADAKVYLTASLEERARRRHAERGDGQGSGYDLVLEELKRRDKIDTERLDSPLKPAEDAIVLITDGETVQDLARLILSYVEKGRKT